jgi:nitrite reductase/ring-hydroxylating ferredoxin subunit
VIRPHGASIVQGGMVSRVKRRQLLRIGFFSVTMVGAAELLGALPSFARVIKIEGLGAKLPAGKKTDVLAAFARTNDAPILNTEGRFFLIHAPGAIAAAYRKCVHLGCAVPWTQAEDQFHCPCHGSLYDKRTALMKRGPASRGLDLFNVSDVNGTLVVDTNPLDVMRRDDNRWHSEHVQVSDA